LSGPGHLVRPALLRLPPAHSAVPDLTSLPYNTGVKTLSASPRRAAAYLLIATVTPALLGGSLGCEQADEIAAYETPRTEPRVTAVDPDEVRAIQDHMFAAVVPAEGNAWFFKLVVPGADAEAMREPFDKFLSTVDVTKSVEAVGSETSDEGKDDEPITHPAWSLPEGWTEEPGGMMRAATVVIPHEDKKFEITVSSLPLNGNWNDYLKVNVDRWMDQLQQPHLTAATIETVACKVSTEHGDATRFELVGTMMKNSMGAGLTGMSAGHPPVSKRTPEGPIEASSPASSQERSDPVDEKLTYDAPEGWAVAPPRPGPFPREASFIVTTDGGRADVGVTKFSAFNQMGQPGPNVRRWAGEVGITNLTDDAVVKAARSITLGGEPALQFEFYSPAGMAIARGTLAVMAKRGDMVWFFKLTGDKATVESQRDAFDAFLKSVRFQDAS
jgi:hypothetical protein